MSYAEPINNSKSPIQEAIQRESNRLREYFSWLEHHMPARFFEELDQEKLWLVTQTLMNLQTSDFFSQINLKTCAIVLCLNTPDADLKVLKKYQNHGIRNYKTYISNSAPLFTNTTLFLRVTIIRYTGFSDPSAPSPSEELLKDSFKIVKTRLPNVSELDFRSLINKIGPRFVSGTNKERLAMATEVFYRASNSDSCQYEIRQNEDRLKNTDIPQLQIVLAWRNVPKAGFLYRLAKAVFRHKLTMKRVSAAYLEDYTENSLLILSLGLNAQDPHKNASEVCDIQDLIKELITLKYFDEMPKIESTFVDSNLVSANMANLLKTATYFVHQMLLQDNPHLYSLNNIEEGLCRHPELTQLILSAFEKRFHPDKHDLVAYEALKEKFLKLVSELDTGNQGADESRKNILKSALYFVEYTLKTNFYCHHLTAYSFRLDPRIMEKLPYDYKAIFPEIPFGIFFMKGMNYLGFHIRFKDLSRGGLRTVIPRSMEQMQIERNNVFAECYNLAYTQLKKNKDIPEGGAKGIIFLQPYEGFLEEEAIYRHELEEVDTPETEISSKLTLFRESQKLEHLYQTQRSYIGSFIRLINCNEDGILKTHNILDYWKKPEYIYLGPDENMHNCMISWIAFYSLKEHYKVGSCFISSKPGAGINHKEYGVTSYGVNEYMEEILRYLGIDPLKDPFTIKISGGPDGDVAGNQIHNLYRFYPKTAKLLAVTDVSGTIFDPNGLDLTEMNTLFTEGKSLRFYNPEKLTEGGFLLDLRTKKEESAYAQSTLLWKKENGKLVQEWLAGNEMNLLYRQNVHSTKTDIFIPGGGRPRTLNDTNFADFLDEQGHPTSKAIVEGANLYLTVGARKALEKLGVLIIKDSSANKGGVICSSLEVLTGLILSDEEFIKHKEILVTEFLAIIKQKASCEAQLLLNAHKESGTPLTELSEIASEKINTFKYQILDSLIDQTLSSDPKDPLIQCLFRYCPKFLSDNYKDRLISKLPDIHKKAIIACYLASRLVYEKGLYWTPSIAEILPSLLKEEF